MANPTTTKWNCLNCNKLDYKPAWLARTRQFCSPKCTAMYKLAKDHLYFLNKGALADPLKISKTLKRKYILGEVKAPMSQLGVIQSQETKDKRSISLKANWASGNRKPAKKPTISPEGLARKIAATQAMRRRIAHNGKLTDIEQIIDNYLHINNIQHEHEYPVGIKCEDFYLPAQQVFIEADGDYWHQDKEKDLRKDLYVGNIMPHIEIVRCSEKSIKEGSWIDLISWDIKRGV